MMKKNTKTNKKKKAIGYYAKKVIMCERSEALEDNKFIKLIWILLKKYYTNKWERWYD